MFDDALDFVVAALLSLSVLLLIYYYWKSFTPEYRWKQVWGTKKYPKPILLDGASLGETDIEPDFFDFRRVLLAMRYFAARDHKAVALLPKERENNSLVQAVLDRMPYYIRFYDKEDNSELEAFDKADTIAMSNDKFNNTNNTTWRKLRNQKRIFKFEFKRNYLIQRERPRFIPDPGWRKVNLTNVAHDGVLVNKTYVLQVIDQLCQWI